MAAFRGIVNIFFPWQLPAVLNGPAVMFDVVAASHNIAYLVSGASELYVATRTNVHFALNEVPDALLIGECEDSSLQGRFASGNDASSVVNVDVRGKKIILITINGTHTLDEIWDKGAEPLITVDYANIHSVAEWLLKERPNVEAITLVPSGGREKVFSSNPDLLEDLLCAESMRCLLRGEEPDFKNNFVLSKRFIDQCYPQHWPTKQADLDLIFTDCDLYPVVPICEKSTAGLMRIVNAYT